MCIYWAAYVPLVVMVGLGCHSIKIKIIHSLCRWQFNTHTVHKPNGVRLGYDWLQSRDVTATGDSGRLHNDFQLEMNIVLQLHRTMLHTCQWIQKIETFKSTQLSASVSPFAEPFLRRRTVGNGMVTNETYSFQSLKPIVSISKYFFVCFRAGEHANIIVPPTWIIKLPRHGSFKSSLRKTPQKKSVNKKKSKGTKAFNIKPIPSLNVTPVLVFINPKSGGNQVSVCT